MSPSDDEYPSSITVFLGHLVGSKEEYPYVKQQYRTFEIECPRPLNGSAIRTVSCPLCHQSVEFRVRSAAAVARLRTTLRLIGASLLAYAALTLIFAFPTAEGTARAVLGFSLVVAVPVGIGFLIYANSADNTLAFPLEPEGSAHKLLREPGGGEA